jgi:hypothetical protein
LKVLLMRAAAIDLKGIENPAWLADCLDPQLATIALTHAMRSSSTPWRSVDVVGASLLRLKPGKRCLFSYDCRTSDGTAMQVLGKVRVRGTDKKLQPLTNHLRDSGIGDPGRITETTAVVPRVWGEVATWHMVLLEFVSGISAEPQADTRAIDHARVSEAVCDLHQVPLHESKEHLAAQELEILRKLYGQFSNDYPQWAQRCWRIWYHLRNFSSHLDCRQTCLIHRDFYFDQVLLLPQGKIALLDLDLACAGPPGLDAGNYIAHLRELAIRQPTLLSACQGAEQAFTERFLQRTESVGERELGFWVLVALARLAALSVRFPERLHTTERLFKAIEAGLQKGGGFARA